MKAPPRTRAYLPLTHALGWIVGSALVVSASAHLGFKAYFSQAYRKAHDPQYRIRTLVQTGPEKEALKTEYLAELMGIASDAPPHALDFDLKAAQAKLELSPLIEKAHVKLLPPSTLYIDYTIRKPVAELYDYENVVIDKEGVPFPLRPFLTPKILPEIYLGLAPFGEVSQDPERPTAHWGKPLGGKYTALAFSLLNLLLDPQIRDLFQVKRIDVSQAFAESYGSREIVVIVEDKIPIQKEGRLIEYQFPKILRLSTQNYAQDLGNYLKLRPQLLAQNQLALQTPPQDTRAKENIIDFRISNLAFIDEQK